LIAVFTAAKPGGRNIISSLEMVSAKLGTHNLPHCYSPRIYHPSQPAISP
jgi:hypothetical protein